MFSTKQFFLMLTMMSVFAFLQAEGPGAPPKGSAGPPGIANPNEQMNETGLKCLLDILHKIESDHSDGTFKGDLKNDGTHTDTVKLNNLFRVGVDQGIDLTTLLLQYYNIENRAITIADGGNKFEINIRKAVSDCNLDLTKSLERCRFAYKKLKGAECERVRWGGMTDLDLAPFVTLKCPPGYKRYGCCKCLRECKHKGLIPEDPKLLWTGFEYCMKKSQIYSDAIVDVKQITDMNLWEIYKGKYVRKCSEGYRRVGDYKCLAVCPLGWPDMGDRCLKRGALMVFPFVWQVGDGSKPPQGAAA